MRTLILTLSTAALVACSADVDTLDSSPLAPGCEDGLDGDRDGYVDAEDPDCFDVGSGDEVTYDGPPVGLALTVTFDEPSRDEMTFTWSVEEGWPATLTLTFVAWGLGEDGADYVETHPWPDIMEPMVFESGSANSDAPYTPHETTVFRWDRLPDYWSLCATHPTRETETCVEGDGEAL